jgi:hypothetical protein
VTNFPKHEQKKPSGKKSPQPLPDADYSPAIVDMTGVEAELATLARYVREYVGNATIGENSLALFTGSGDAYSPLRLVLEGDAVDSIADSLKRMADAMGKP